MKKLIELNPTTCNDNSARDSVDAHHLVKWLAVTTISMGLSACASSPDELTAQHVSTLRYEESTCKQLVLEMDYANERLGQLYTSLDKKAGDDAAQMGIGLVLFWPALFFLEGGDGPEAAEYSRLRGEVDAMRRAAIHKECDLTNVRSFIPPKKEEAAPDGRTSES